MKPKKSKQNVLASDKVARTEDRTAESLVKSPSFQWRVALKVAMICGFLVIASGLLTNWWLWQRFSSYVVTTDLDVSNRIFTAKHEITNQIAKEFETERIKQAVSEVASNRANVILTVQLLPEVHRLRENVSNQMSLVARSISDLTNASSFSMTLIAANGDDRSAFKQLQHWSEDANYSYRAEAARAVVTITDYHNFQSGIEGAFYPPWGTDPDPKHPFSALGKIYAGTPSREYRIGILQSAMKRDDFSKLDKVGLLISVMHNESDLRVLSMAGRFFREQTGFNMKTLRTEDFFSWWDRNFTNLTAAIK